MKRLIKVQDSSYVIMTSDKKCILKGRKNTNFILVTLDENTQKKLYVCRHKSDVIERLNSEFSSIWLSDEVMKMYGVKSKSYKVNKKVMPELIAVKVNVAYEIEV